MNEEPREMIVIARRTSMSPPPDATHSYDPPGLFAPSHIDRVVVSATFSWDRPRAEWLAVQWRDRYPDADVQVGGPAYGDPGGEFVPGRFLKQGVTITTRGCPGCASPCLVPGREGAFRCIPIRDGNVVVDNNLAAAPHDHIERVLAMLRRQRAAPRFSGGLEARRMLDRPWFMDALADIRGAEIWTAYDCDAEHWPALAFIGEMRRRGVTRKRMRCYVLCGRDDDTVPQAVARCRDVLTAGGMPMAMLWRPDDATARRRDTEWSAMVRTFSRPALTKHEIPGRHPKGTT